METWIRDPALSRKLIRQRRAAGVDRFDEVWEGVYLVSPLANDEHQEVAGKLYFALEATIGQTSMGHVRPGANVSDRAECWRKNYRCPDVVVFLTGNPAINKKTHWFGGPDLAVEVVSKNDQSRKKFDFYAKIGTRELLVVDRYPWALELYRLADGVLTLVGQSSLERPEFLDSNVLPLSFRIVAGEPRARIEVTHHDGLQRWSA